MENQAEIKSHLKDFDDHWYQIREEMNTFRRPFSPYERLFIANQLHEIEIFLRDKD